MNLNEKKNINKVASHSTMTTPPIPLVSPGDLVYCEGSLCYVETVTNTLGYNIYTIVDCDSGRKMQKARYQLEKPDLNPVDLDFITDIEEGEDPLALIPEKKKKYPKKDLQMLQKMM